MSRDKVFFKFQLNKTEELRQSCEVVPNDWVGFEWNVERKSLEIEFGRGEADTYNDDLIRCLSPESTEVFFEWLSFVRSASFFETNDS